MFKGLACLFVVLHCIRGSAVPFGFRVDSASCSLSWLNLGRKVVLMFRGCESPNLITYKC